MLNTINSISKSSRHNSHFKHYVLPTFLYKQKPLATPLAQLITHLLLSFRAELPGRCLSESYPLLQFSVDSLCNKLLLFKLAVTATSVNPVALSPVICFHSGRSIWSSGTLLCWGILSFPTVLPWIEEPHRHLFFISSLLPIPCIFMALATCWHADLCNPKAVSPDS